MKGHEQYDIIIVTMSRWDDAYSSAIHSLAKELAKGNRVFYIDHPFTWKDFFSDYNTLAVKKRKGALLFGKDVYKTPEKGLERFIAVTPPLILPVNWLSPGAVYQFFSGLNDKIFYSAVRRIIKDYEVKKFIFFNSFDPFFAHTDFPDDIKPELCIYQTRDDISQQSYVARHGVKLEEQAVKKADLVLATSKELTKSKSLISKNTFLLPNAADVILFKKASNPLTKPAELEGIKGKIIGYTGNISQSRIDFPLLKEIALKRPDDYLVLVGPVDSDAYKQHGLDQMDNVIFTWAKPFQELPFYLSYMDCTIIPFQCNTLTKSIYPLKLNEYLAAGKPVVSTNFSDDLKDFEDVIYLAGDNDEFLKKVSLALAEDDDQRKDQRIKTAEQNSWTARVESFWEILSPFLDKSGIEAPESANLKFL